MSVVIIIVPEVGAATWDSSSLAKAVANRFLVIGLGLPCRLAGMVIIILSTVDAATWDTSSAASAIAILLLVIGLGLP